jgi:hypothetical protein
MILSYILNLTLCRNIVSVILSYCELEDLSSATRVCKGWRQLLLLDEVCEEHACQRTVSD